MPTIAVLFLVIDALPFADIWQRWAASSRTHPRSARVRFFLHAKDRDALLCDRRTPRWVRECTLPISYRPEWGSVELVRATLALVEEALRDASVDWLLLASESCLPVKSLDAALRALTSADAGAGRSWLLYDLPHSRYDAERFDTLRSCGVPPTAICKADQWFCLTRCHAQAVVDGGRDVFWRAFKTITASDEWYFPTCMCLSTFLDLAVLRTHDDAVKDQERRRELYGPRLPLPPLATVEDHGNVAVARRRVTFRVWPVATGPSPEWIALTAETVRRAVAEGCIFARKFKPHPHTSLAAWEALVLSADDATGCEVVKS